VVERRKRSADELLRDIEAEEAEVNRGRLKIFLGYASGVGKSFRMLDEARRRRMRGQDVVVGGIQPKVPPEVEDVLRHLEIVSRGMNVDAILKRRPEVCFIDGLAYDNPPGSRNPTRWRDVQELLNAGISVVTSVNIHYISELKEQVAAITGKRPAESVPVSFIKSAAEIEIVDAPPERSMGDQERLSKLRQLALVLAADVVDYQLNAYLEAHGITQHFGTHEKIMVAVTPRTNVREMLETAKAIAERFHGELIAAYVNQPGIPAEDKAALEERLEAARKAGASIEILEGEEPVSALLDFAESRGITQLFVGHTQRSGLFSRLMGNPVDKIILESRGMDVRIFPQ